MCDVRRHTGIDSVDHEYINHGVRAKQAIRENEKSQVKIRHIPSKPSFAFAKDHNESSCENYVCRYSVAEAGGDKPLTKIRM